MKVAAFVAVGLAISVPAASQVIERPARASAPANESDSWRRVTFGVTTLGSWDDNLTAEQALVDSSIPSQSGYTGFADTSLRFEQGKASQSFGASARGYVNTFRNVGITPQYGAEARVSFGRSVGRRVRFEASQILRDEPYYTIGGFAGLRQDVALSGSPDANPLNGVEPRRSWAGSSHLTVISQWSARNALDGSYRYDIRDYRDHIGDTRAHDASLSYRRNAGRRSMLRFTYGYNDSEFREPAATIPLETHAAEAGANLERRFSSTRRLAVLFGSGFMRVRTLDSSTREAYEVLAPSGFGGVRLDWARSWSASADYRRIVAPLAGLSAQAFTTDAVVAGVGGFVSRRTELTFSVAYAEGRSRRDSASFDTHSGTSQLRFTLTRDWAALISHTYHRYSLRNVDLLFGRLPAKFDRNSVRVGVALNLPVVGRRELDRPERNERNDASR